MKVNNENITSTYLLNNIFHIGDITVNPSQNRLYIGQDEKILQPKVLELLTLLCAAQGQTLSKQLLVDALWPNTVVGPDSLANTMARLRKALNDDAKNAQFIETVQRKGYRWLKPLNVEKGRSSKRTYMVLGLICLLIMITVALWQSFMVNVKPKFIYTDLHVLPLQNGGYEVKVGFDGKLTDERKLAMLAEVKRITGEEHSGMEFSIDEDEVDKKCIKADNKSDKICLKKDEK